MQLLARAACRGNAERLPRTSSATLVRECGGHPYMLALLGTLLHHNPDR